MCLRTEQRKPQIATENIICYKVIRKDMSSLFHEEFKWEFGKLYETEMETSFSPFLQNALIEKGFHSYSTLEGTREAYFASLKPCIVVKCTIPEGTPYYTGTHSKRNGYTSEKIIVNEIIPFKELYPNFDFDKYPYKVDDKVSIKFKEDFRLWEGVIQNVQPDYATNNVDILVSFGDKYTYITTKFNGLIYIIEPVLIHPILEQRVTIEQFKIKEN